MIDTPEKRRSVIDFGKSPRGTGMPFAKALVDQASQQHVLNLYTGILVIPVPIVFWRKRKIQGDCTWLAKPETVNNCDWLSKAGSADACSWLTPAPNADNPVVNEDI